MEVEWNKVTWYSKIASIILFVLVFYIGFCLGKYSAQKIIPDSSPVQTSSVVSQTAVVEPINIVSYTCGAGKVIIAKYFQGESKPAPSPDMPPVPGGSAVLYLGDGRAFTLSQTISADGGRYANPDESFVFWSKGNTAFITEGSPNNTTYKGCVVASQTAKP